MGNAEFRSTFESTQREDFSATKLDEFESGLWSESSVNESFSRFINVAAGGNKIDFYKLFKVLSEVRAD